MLRSIPLMEAADSFDFEVTRRKPMTNGDGGSASPRRTFAGHNHGRYVQFNALVFAGLQSSNRFTTEMSSVNVETFVPTRTLRRIVDPPFLRLHLSSEFSFKICRKDSQILFLSSTSVCKCLFFSTSLKI